MASKIETARAKAESFIRTDDERLRLESAISMVENRTQPDGFVSVTLDDAYKMRIPATIIIGFLESQRLEKEGQLSDEADNIK